MEMQVLNTVNEKLTGFDAYENAWDRVSKQLWSALRFNVFWFICFFTLLIVVFLLTVVRFESWISFITISVILFLILSPLWEAANILRFSTTRQFLDDDKLPVMKIVVARLIFLFIVGFGYLAFVLPGIYMHCRFCLYLPIILRARNISPWGSLYKSWILTRSRFVKLYTLWIAVVISKPVCLLPFGLGFIFERPICGLAKDHMFLNCSNLPRDGPD